MENNFLAREVVKKFHSLYQYEPLLVKSPGRVNIIGEHTDYNDGFVLPAAIDKGIYLAIQKRDDDIINLFSEEFNEVHESSINDLKPSDQHWANYLLGVADQLIKRGYEISGFNAVLNGDIPIGAGLSSSAAVECATAYALNEIFNLNIKKKELAEIAQKAEHTFAGVLCGIMDQFASLFGKDDHVIKLDCRSLDYEYVPLKLDGYKILLLNTNVKHSLASSEYNTRREQCEQGVDIISRKYPEVKKLRDVNTEMLEEMKEKMNKTVYMRCKFVVEENERLLTGCDDLKSGDLKSLGDKMFLSHKGLSELYEVSCPELDFLVEKVKNNSNVLGARMMGGGFGGCTINIVREEAIENLIDIISEAYQTEMGKELTPYIAQIEKGTSVITRQQQ